MRLSVALPVFNFAEFLPAALHSILDQNCGQDVEVVVTDGASTDDTPAIMERMCAIYPNLAYNRLPLKGGIDKDMALAVAATRGEYVWLFSGDDIMHDGALAFMLDQISSGDDVYLCRHAECTSWMEPLFDYPVLNPDNPEIFDLSNPERRRVYFDRAVNSEAFFSFCSGLVIRRKTWDRVTPNQSWDGTCWAHSYRLFAALNGGLRVNYLARVLLDRRGDNDSFSNKGLVERYRIQVDGFHDIINANFGSHSHEAREMRRVIRNEFTPTVTRILKLLQHLHPERESKATLDRIVARAYSDLTWRCIRTRIKYKWMPHWMLDRKYRKRHRNIFEPETYRAEMEQRKALYIAKMQTGKVRQILETSKHE